MARALAHYAERRQYFSPPRRREVAKHVAQPLLEQFGLPSNTSYDLLLCAMYYRLFIADRGDDETHAARARAAMAGPSAGPVTSGPAETPGPHPERRTMKVAALLEQRQQNWFELDRLCGQSRRTMDAATVARFAAMYRAACADLALADAYQLPPNTVQYLHQLVGRAHNQLYRSRPFDLAAWGPRCWWMSRGGSSAIAASSWRSCCSGPRSSLSAALAYQPAAGPSRSCRVA